MRVTLIAMLGTVGIRRRFSNFLVRTSAGMDIDAHADLLA